MIFSHVLIIGLLLFSGAHVPEVADAQGQVTEDTCIREINRQLYREQRMYRATLFGEPAVKDAPVGAVKFDADGKTWIRIAPAPPEDEYGNSTSDEDTWASVSGAGDETMSDSEAAETFGLHPTAAASAPEGTARVDENREIWVKTGGSWKKGLGFRKDDEMSGDIPAQPGIFATREVLTSSLVPSLTQNLRALQCSTESFCDIVEQSFVSENGYGQANIPGCSATSGGPIPGCSFVQAEGSETEVGRLLSYCDRTAEELVKREAELLKLAVEYDAAYRTLLQFAGNFDLALQEFRWPLVFTFRQAASVIVELGRIPCFLASCDAYPNPNEPSFSSP